MKTLDEIQLLAKAYADARTLVAERVTALQEELETIKRRRLAGIKLAVGGARDAHDELVRGIDESRSLFANPKTITVHGIRLGLQKGKGKITWAKGTDDKIVAAIEKRLAEKASVLIRIEKKPIKKAISALSVAELKAIGCTVIEAGDEVFVKTTDDDVDKLVSALLDEKPEADGAEE